MTKTPSRNQFTIGWVSAITKEYTAARQVLDGVYKFEFDRPSEEDRNTYTYGRIGKHYVVVACLPPGHYGPHYAAEAGDAMKSSFPTIRFVLMVGIAGGAPTPDRDIRLGDVVVGTEVVPYDQIKETPGVKQFNGHTRLSARPLLTGSQKLAALLDEGELDIDASIKQSFVRTRKITVDYCKPADTSDRLYQSDHVHVNDCDCVREVPRNTIGLVHREKRDEYERLQVHMGRIGSAHVVVKNAKRRDELAAEHNLLCFEMESAGLMGRFPCLPIRGICDYSDSHKNKRWQGYAAAAAAVYAKSLLENIPPEEVQETDLPTLSADHMNQHIRPIIDEAMQVMSSNLADTVARASKADLVLERISEAINLLYQLSRAHTANIESASKQTDTEKVQAYADAINANQKLMEAVAQSQRELMETLEGLTAYIEKQMQSSTDAETRRGLEGMRRRAQDDHSNLRNMAKLTEKAVNCTTGILGEVAIDTKNPAVKRAAGWLGQYGNIAALAEELSKIVPRGMTSAKFPSVRAPPKISRSRWMSELHGAMAKKLNSKSAGPSRAQSPSVESPPPALPERPESPSPNRTNPQIPPDQAAKFRNVISQIHSPGSEDSTKSSPSTVRNSMEPVTPPRPASSRQAAKGRPRPPPRPTHLSASRTPCAKDASSRPPIPPREYRPKFPAEQQ